MTTNSSYGTSLGSGDHQCACYRYKGLILAPPKRPLTLVRKDKAKVRIFSRFPLDHFLTRNPIKMEKIKKYFFEIFFLGFKKKVFLVLKAHIQPILGPFLAPNPSKNGF